jgi:hypothetical protein
MAPIGTIIAVTTEDDQFADARRAAIERARREGAALVLYDIDAGGDPLESPLPTKWSAEGTDKQVGDRLGPAELEAAGRAPIARQVLEARGQGVDAWGWLPANAGPEALRDYAAQQPNAVVMDPRVAEDAATR